MAKLVRLYDESVIISVASLAAKDAIAAASKIDASREVGFRVLKTEGWAFLKAAVSDEVVIFGVDAFILSAAGVEESIESDSQSPFDFANVEKASRPVFPLGALSGLSAQPGNGILVHFTNEIPWTYPEGTGMEWWAYNPDDDALSAGSQQVIIFAQHQGVWLRD